MTNQEELHKQLVIDIENSKSKIDQLMKDDPLDEDGYPTESCLEIVRSWHWSDPTEYFKFIKSVWWYGDMLWKEEDVPHRFKKDTIVHQHKVSTGGWSGNESIIRAMEECEFMWSLNWVQSRRGGHYIFEEYEVKK